MRKADLIEQLREARRQARGLEQVVDRLLEVVESTPQNDTSEGIDQRDSVLGPRRHCAAVRRRIAERKGGATVIGRRHLLSPVAYAEEQALSAGARLARCAVDTDPEEEAAYQALLKRIGN